MSLSKEEQKRCDKWFFSWMASDSFHDEGTYKELVEKIWIAAIHAKDKEIEDHEELEGGLGESLHAAEAEIEALKSEIKGLKNEIEALKSEVKDLTPGDHFQQPTKGDYLRGTLPDWMR